MAICLKKSTSWKVQKETCKPSKRDLSDDWKILIDEKQWKIFKNFTRFWSMFPFYTPWKHLNLSPFYKPCFQRGMGIQCKYPANI